MDNKIDFIFSEGLIQWEGISISIFNQTISQHNEEACEALDTTSFHRNCRFWVSPLKRKTFKLLKKLQRRNLSLIKLS